MPQPLTLPQMTDLSERWQAHATTLQGYQKVRAADPKFDAIKCQAWIDQSLAISTQFAEQQIVATFDDAEAASKSLANVVDQAAIFVKQLQSKVQSWNKIASTGNAILALVAGLATPPSGIAILGLADKVAQAYTGSPAATATSPAPSP